MAIIRHATEEDAERIFELIVALASHHGQSENIQTNTTELRRAGFGPAPKYHVLLAESDETVIGFLSYTICYSIWSGESYMQIDDVYVCPGHRGSGIGEALMREAQSHSENLGLSRLKWEVENDNESAIRFYERLGASYFKKGIFQWAACTW